MLQLAVAATAVVMWCTLLPLQATLVEVLLGQTIALRTTLTPDSPLISIVSNSSGSSLQFRVRVQNEPLSTWLYGLSIHANCQLVFGSMRFSQHIWIGWVVSGSPSRSTFRFIYGFCVWGLIIDSYQNRVFNSEWFNLKCFAVCDIDYFGISVFPLIDCVFAYRGGQNFCYVLQYLGDGLITRFGRSNIVDAPLMLLSWYSRECVAVVFAPNGCHHLINECLQPIRT